MPLKVIVKKESPFREVKGIVVDENKVVIMDTGSHYGNPWVTVAVQIDPDTFGELAKAMMGANANEAIKAFRQAMQAGIERPASSN
jgi:hypothetical protein